VTPLVQNSFRAGHAIVRPDGSLIVPGAVAAIQYTGEGEGFLSDAAAIVALTPSFELDPAFGGTARPARIAVRVPRQRAVTTADRRLLRIAVTATTSGPGLCLLEARAGRRVVARSTAPVYATGTQRLPALLTLTGRRVLPHARHVRVTVTARFRDLIGAEASARATGVLR